MFASTRSARSACATIAAMTFNLRQVAAIGAFCLVIGVILGATGMAWMSHPSTFKMIVVPMATGLLMGVAFYSIDWHGPKSITARVCGFLSVAWVVLNFLLACNHGGSGGVHIDHIGGQVLAMLVFGVIGNFMNPTR